jgi:hypothetical protein
LARLSAGLIDQGRMPPEFTAQGLSESDLSPIRCQI